MTENMAPSHLYSHSSAYCYHVHVDRKRPYTLCPDFCKYSKYCCSKRESMVSSVLFLDNWLHRIAQSKWVSQRL